MFFLLVRLRACALRPRAACAFAPSNHVQPHAPRTAEQVPRGSRPEASYYCSWTGSIGRLPLQVGIFFHNHGNVADDMAPVAPVGRQLVLNCF